ncbi:DUF2207 domain-containing protein [Marisediminicola sp. LYQ85]|uniref:DUF2207 domain-containing protein n=1 Tax=Marisediminicola sp. LYQ85 TaxID=3391062 RepID=UPI00398341B2
MSARSVLTRSSAALAALGFVALLTGGGAASAPASASSLRADVDDFTFSSFDAVYELSADDEGRSQLRVTETIVAEFPDFDQNRGIFRVIPDRYDGHPIDLEIVSVTDESGEPREVESEDGGEVTIAGDDFVRGQQTYVITWEARNVTRFADDTGVDEFYWDVNGVDWAQPFDSVSATVVVDPELVDSLTGDIAAIAGETGATLSNANITSDSSAVVEATDDGLVASATDLDPEETLTIAIAFEPETFVPRDNSFGAAPWPTISLVAMIVALAAAVWALVLRRTMLADAPGRGTIVAEYLPPKDASVAVAALVLHKQSVATTAQILDLAVTGHVRIVDESTSSKPRYRLDYLTDEGATPDQREALHALFGATLTPGENRSLKKANEKSAKRFTKLAERVKKDAATDDTLKRVSHALPGIAFTVALVAGLVSAVFAAVSLGGAFGGGVPILFLLASAAAIVVALTAVAKVPLGARGVRVRDHLLGLKTYIDLAEAERLRFLQSPEGAERARVSVDDPAEVVRLHEKLLPYAVLFGVEKKWAAELGRFYEQNGTEPGWYSGSTTFNAAVFASTISSVSTSVSSYSSPSGGTGGGISAGGGGGGGGGGGV